MFVEYERILKILDSISSLRRQEKCYGRINYYAQNSRSKKKIVISQLSHTGNGYIRCGHLEKYKKDADKSECINIKKMSEDKLREMVEDVVISLT